MESPQSHREHSHVAGWWYVSSGRSRGQQSQQNNWTSGFQEFPPRLLTVHIPNRGCRRAAQVTWAECSPWTEMVGQNFSCITSANCHWWRPKPKASNFFCECTLKGFLLPSKLVQSSVHYWVNGVTDVFISSSSKITKYFSAHILFRNLNWLSPNYLVLVNEMTWNWVYAFNQFNSQRNFARFCV